VVVGELLEGTDVLVVGGGPGGYVAAIRAAELGREVMLAEMAAVGGVCLNVGCIPSKALITAADWAYRAARLETLGIHVDGVRVDVPALQRWKASVVAKLTGGVEQLLRAHGVKIVRGRASFTGPGEAKVETGSQVVRIAWRDAIVATGSRPVAPALLEPDGERVLDSTALLAAERVPEELVVVGAGYIGLELGTVFAKLGSRVTIVEALDGILPGLPRDLVRPVADRLAALGVTVRTGTRVVGRERSGDRVVLNLESAQGTARLEAETVLVAVGRRPNTEDLGLEHIGLRPDAGGYLPVDAARRTPVPHVYAIGDVAGGPLLAHKASMEGRVAAEAIAGRAGAAFDVRAMPAVIFTDPEIATVGLSEADARAAGYEVVVGRFPFAANGRALTLDAGAGHVKLVADRASGVVLGAEMVGPEVSSLVAEVALAIEGALTLEDVAATVHAHPTLPEAVAEAAEVALGLPIHVLGPMRRAGGA
jgi:dihydrolipoamide dehydrogenase